MGGQDLCGAQGYGPCVATSLIIRQSNGQVSVAMGTRQVMIEPVNARLLRPVV